MSARSYDINKLNKKQSNIRVTKEGSTTIVVLHDTTILKIDNGRITLNSGGWVTNTTKTAINRGLKQLNVPFTVFQKKGQWKVYNYMLNYDIDFVDNMTLL